MNSKIILVGDGGVGKTVLVSRLIGQDFDKKYIATIGVWKATYKNLNILDCAGQEKFSGLGDGYYIGADYAIVMFDISNRTSFRNIPRWINKIRHVVPNIKIILVGNKSDIEGKKVSIIAIHLMINKINKINNIKMYFEVSAKDSVNINDPFDYIINDLSVVDAPAGV